MSDFKAEVLATEEINPESTAATPLEDEILDNLSGGIGDHPIAD